VCRAVGRRHCAPKAIPVAEDARAPINAGVSRDGTAKQKALIGIAKIPISVYKCLGIPVDDAGRLAAPAAAAAAGPAALGLPTLLRRRRR